MFNNFGITEILIIAAIIIVLFGTKKVPEFLKGIGLAIKEFKKALKDEKD